MTEEKRRRIVAGYLKRLAGYKALPWWKRWFTPEPVQPALFDSEDVDKILKEDYMPAVREMLDQKSMFARLFD